MALASLRILLVEQKMLSCNRILFSLSGKSVVLSREIDAQNDHEILNEAFYFSCFGKYISADRQRAAKCDWKGMLFLTRETATDSHFDLVDLPRSCDSPPSAYRWI